MTDSEWLAVRELVQNLWPRQIGWTVEEWNMWKQTLAKFDFLRTCKAFRAWKRNHKWPPTICEITPSCSEKNGVDHRAGMRRLMMRNLTNVYPDRLGEFEAMSTHQLELENARWELDAARDSYPTQSPTLAWLEQKVERLSQ